MFNRHNGAVMELARRLEVSHTMVSLWLKGKSTSKRVSIEACKLADELLAAEEKAQKQGVA